MLSEDAINNLIQPIIDRQESINTYVIKVIAQRIKEIGGLLPSDIHKLERLLYSGADVRKINAEIARLTGLQVRDIKKLIRTVALDSYVDAKPYYDYRKLPYIPFSQNKKIQQVVTAIANRTAGEYINLSNTRATGFLIRDLKNPNKLKFQSIGNTYKTVVDEAIQAVQSGTIDYNTAIRKTMRQLVDSGVRRIYWDSGYSMRLDSAVKRNILEGVRAINQGVQDETGKQFKADGKELSVHMNSAPDHEPIQGRQFTNEEVEKMQSGQPFKDVNGKEYPGMERAIGMWNCRHYMWSIIVGVTKPNYSEKELQKMAERNAQGYTFKDGKHLSMYECEQYQRQLETKIRTAKDGQIASLTYGDKDEAIRYQVMINKYTQQYKMFSKNCGLSPKLNNLTVSGYRRIAVKK